MDGVGGLEHAEHLVGVRPSNGLVVTDRDVLVGSPREGVQTSDVHIRRVGRNGDGDGVLFGIPEEEAAFHIFDRDGEFVVVGLVALLAGTVVPCVTTLGSETDQNILVQPLAGLLTHVPLLVGWMSCC